MAAVALLVGFYVVAAALVAVLVWLAFVTAVAWTVLFVVLAALLVLAVARVSKLPALVVSGPSFPVDPAAQPGLWAQVREVAQAVGARPPSKIVLIPVADAAVAEDAWLLGLLGGRRTLLIGIPLLAGLSTDQFRALLAQQFVPDSVVRRGRDQLQRVLVAVRRSRVLHAFFTRFAALYFRLSASAMCTAESDGDAAAARLTSPATVVAVVRERAAIVAAWPPYALAHGAEELPPVEFSAAFRAFIDARPPVEVGQEPRIAAVEKLPDTAHETDDRPAFAVFQGDALS